MKLNKLYSRTSTGATQTWEIEVINNSFVTHIGQLDGKISSSKPTVCEGKNEGRANETTGAEQALKEAKAKWQKKIDAGYTEDVDNIDNSTSFFEPMLAAKYIDRKDKVKFPVLVSRKLDGLRMVCTKKGLTTRKGKPFNSCPHIHKILKPIFDKHPNWVIDGEIYSDAVPFEKIVSLTRQKDPDANDLIESEKYCQLWIFDGVVDNKKETFVNRFDTICKEINALVGKSKSLKFVENTQITKHEEVETYHNQFVSEGFEGLMIRNPNSIYENKRSKELLKYKHFHDEEFKIVDIEEGKGNRSGMAGNIVINLKNGVVCSPGIKGGEEFYKELLKNKKQYIGKKATVRYQGITEDGNLRFPVAVCIDPIDR